MKTKVTLKRTIEKQLAVREAMRKELEDLRKKRKETLSDDKVSYPMDTYN